MRDWRTNRAAVEDMMPKLAILRFPDPALRRPALPVTCFDEDLRKLAADLSTLLDEVSGLGLTAPHAGISMRLVVLRLRPDDVAIFINPRILWSSADTARCDEGSLSMPGIVAEVERPSRIRLDYQDLDGVTHAEEADGLRAVCLQHEIDQLDGIFWTARLSPLRRDQLMRRYAKLRKWS
jgi:peptide deformylase